jgi:hypothetical protein
MTCLRDINPNTYLKQLQIIKQVKAGMYGSNRNNNKKLYFSASYNSKLQSLTLMVPTLRISYIKYITEFMPAQLNTLDIDLRRIDLYDCIDQVGLDNALKLTNLMCRIENACIDFNADKYYQRSSTSTSESKMTKVFRLVGSLKGDLKLFCKASFSDFRPNLASIDIMGNSGSMSFNYGLDRENYGEIPPPQNDDNEITREEDNDNNNDDGKIIVVM